jgi:hypothetical protein
MARTGKMEKTKKYKRSRGARKALQFVVPGAYDAPPLYLHMFQQDVQMIGHFSPSRRSEEQVFHLEGTEENLAKADALCGSLGGDHGYRRGENVAGAIEKVVLYLAHVPKPLLECSPWPPRQNPARRACPICGPSLLSPFVPRSLPTLSTRGWATESCA